jgi:hypothetical protein
LPVVDAGYLYRAADHRPSGRFLPSESQSKLRVIHECRFSRGAIPFRQQATRVCVPRTAGEMAFQGCGGRLGFVDDAQHDGAATRH